MAISVIVVRIVSALASCFAKRVVNGNEVFTFDDIRARAFSIRCCAYKRSVSFTRSYRLFLGIVVVLWQ